MSAYAIGNYIATMCHRAKVIKIYIKRLLKKKEYKPSIIDDLFRITKNNYFAPMFILNECFFEIPIQQTTTKRQRAALEFIKDGVNGLCINAALHFAFPHALSYGLFCLYNKEINVWNTKKLVHKMIAEIKLDKTLCIDEEFTLPTNRPCLAMQLFGWCPSDNKQNDNKSNDKMVCDGGHDFCLYCSGSGHTLLFCPKVKIDVINKLNIINKLSPLQRYGLMHGTHMVVSKWTGDNNKRKYIPYNNTFRGARGRGRGRSRASRGRSRGGRGFGRAFGRGRY